MDTSSHRAGASDITRGAVSRRRDGGGSARAKVIGGGTDGNEQLTATVGTILLVLLVVMGVTILRLHQLIAVHQFVGVLLVGPLALKATSTGYRFTRYYTGDPAYRRKGPPRTVLRVIAPMVALSTISLLASGLLLALEGPSHRGPLVLIHQASCVIWVVFIAMHVVGHLPAIIASRRAPRRAVARSARFRPGATGRWIALTVALAAGLALAFVLMPDAAAWSAGGALMHHGR